LDSEWFGLANKTPSGLEDAEGFEFELDGNQSCVLNFSFMFPGIKRLLYIAA